MSGKHYDWTPNFWSPAEGCMYMCINTYIWEDITKTELDFSEMLDRLCHSIFKYRNHAHWKQP